MTKRTQIVVSLGMVLAAAVIVTTYTLKAEDRAVTAAAGHDHSTMGASAASEARPVMLDPESERRIGVTFATAALKPSRRTVSTVGNVTWDERRLANVSPKIEGWVEHLYIDFTGAPVRKGQPLLSLYSPMLVSAQEELILAGKLVRNTAAGGSERVIGNAQEVLESARRRLRYWDIPDEEIARIEESAEPRKTLTLMAPASGIVIEKNVTEGARVMPGMDLYRIADLSRVWVEGEVFEKDLSLVRTGQPASVTFEAYPGETFRGTVTYVYPTVSIETRTGRIRVELANPDLRFKPGMYARLVLEAGGDRTVLTIPRSAVHFTGERALVFVRDADGMLVPREITAGLASGDDIEVLAGLTEGETVVNSANFLIDAESNMGSSMMSMPGMEGGSTEDTAPAGAMDPGMTMPPLAKPDTTAHAGPTGH
ncbi:MAG: efflux RND transporter periplasmic adaptor subunit [Gemmatimonadota bacterium]|jgi:Cu(I)/Ag(I) efflux system membrane fusion protein